MARPTRSNSPSNAPARNLRSGSLGAGERTDNGPGSRESAGANQGPEEIDEEDLETMRREQSDIRQSGRIAGYRNDNKLTARQREFHKLLTDEMNLSHDTADEIFRQGIDGFQVIEGLSDSDINSIVVSMHKNKSSYCVSFFLNTLFQRNISLIRKWIAFQKTVGGDPSEFGWKDYSFKQTIDRENYYAVRKLDDPPESLFPPKFKEI